MNNTVRGMVAWIAAVRQDPVVGSGSGSIFDCWSDHDIGQTLTRHGIRGKIESVRWARQQVTAAVEPGAANTAVDISQDDLKWFDYLWSKS